MENINKDQAEQLNETAVISQPKYTQGNWYFQTEADVYTNIIRCDAGKGKETLYIGCCEQSANAQLMASAPDLLEALQSMLKAFGEIAEAFDEKEVKEKAEKAIEKALIIKEKRVF